MSYIGTKPVPKPSLAEIAASPHSILLVFTLVVTLNGKALDSEMALFCLI